MRRAATLRQISSHFQSARQSAWAARASEEDNTKTIEVHSSLGRKARLKNISKSLELYLEKLRAHEKMMKHESAEFELGKRHLANIMGWPSEMKITQDHIDRAIEYLFPSGLFDLKALPVMKPPEEILPAFKKMDFDENSRPMDPLFYTLTPKFYTLLSEINKRTLGLIQQQDNELLEGLSRNRFSSLRGNADVDENTMMEVNNELAAVEEPKLILSSSEWMPKEVLMKRVLDGERISDDMYASCILALDYLVQLPLSHLCSDFIMSLRQHLTGDAGTQNLQERPIFGAKVPKVELDTATNRRYAVGRGKVKRVIAEVSVTDAGTGDYTVNGHHYSEFRPIVSREILLCPLLITDLLGKVDVNAKILEHAGSGTVLIPRAVRHGASLAIAALYPQYRETLRLAGLLTFDPRKKERSKVNQPGARAKWIWKKR